MDNPLLHIAGDMRAILEAGKQHPGGWYDTERKDPRTIYAEVFLNEDGVTWEVQLCSTGALGVAHILDFGSADTLAGAVGQLLKKTQDDSWGLEN